MACNHKFQGHQNGVTCLLCGLHLTPQQYHELLHPPESPQNALSDTGEKEPAKTEKASQAAAKSPQKKIKRTAKKKEVANDD